MKKVITYSAGLIAIFLIVQGTSTGTVLKEGSDGAVKLIKAFQGRK